MSKNGSDEAAPTMIIPRGTEIEVDAHGQLSIRAPGNLVIQNSGAYGTIESRGGSLRIDHNVEVEAVSVKCADTCFVQGRLTAWKVTAKALHVEDTAQAQVVMQETERLEIGRDARVVGNFESEKELFLLFSRFGRQLRQLPFYFENKDAPAELGEGADDVEGGAAGDTEQDARAAWFRRTRGTTAPGQSSESVIEPLLPGGAPPLRDDLPEQLFFALVLLERDADREGYGPTSQRVLEEVIKLLQQRDLETLRHTFRTLFGRILEPREDVERARELVAGYFGVPDDPTAPPPDDEEEDDETQS